MKISVVDISEAAVIPVMNWSEYDLAILSFKNWDLIAPADTPVDDDEPDFTPYEDTHNV